MNVNYINVSLADERDGMPFISTCRFFPSKYTSHKQKDLIYRYDVRIEEKQNHLGVLSSLFM